VAKLRLTRSLHFTVLARDASIAHEQRADFIFRHPGVRVGNSAGTNLAAGIDTRGNNGYIVAPPSLHSSGALYEWEQSPGAAPLADLPAWLTSATEQPEQPEQLSNRAIDARLLVGVIEKTLPTAHGQRNRCIWKFVRELKAIPAVRRPPGESVLRTSCVNGIGRR